jgi:hypothetical protein
MNAILASPPARSPWDFANPLFHYTDKDVWSVGDSLTGAMIIGGTGTGKSSASGRTLLVSMMRHGYGGLMTTAKPDDRAFLLDCAAEAGRLDSVAIFAPDQPWRFNFLDHQWKAGAGNVLDLENLFASVLRTLSQGQGSEGGSDYWHRSALQLIRNCLHLNVIARDRVVLEDLFQIVESAPQKIEDVADADWQKDSFCYRLTQECIQRAGSLPPGRMKDSEMSSRYFLHYYAGLAPETRSIFDQTFSSFADPLLRDPLRGLFCTETNLVPEALFDGVIVLCDLSKAVFGEAGRIGTTVLKQSVQRALQRRLFRPGDRPVFMYIDECQLYISPEDALFQTIARGTGVAVVQLTQNIDNLVAAMGQSFIARYQVASLLGCLATLIFHANRSSETNKFASETIGATLQRRVGTNTGRNDGSPNSHHTGASTFEMLLAQVLPHEFQLLRTGGERNGLLVDAFVLQQGRVFSNGKNYLPVVFSQARAGRPA